MPISCTVVSAAAAVGIQASHKSSFLDFLPEIREVIYHKALLLEPARKIKVVARENRTNHFIEIPAAPVLTSLALTCKTICAETDRYFTEQSRTLNFRVETLTNPGVRAHCSFKRLCQTAQRIEVELIVGPEHCVARNTMTWLRYVRNALQDAEYACELDFTWHAHRCQEEEEGSDFQVYFDWNMAFEWSTMSWDEEIGISTCVECCQNLRGCGAYLQFMSWMECAEKDRCLAWVIKEQDRASGI